MARFDFRGAAAKCTASGSVSSGATTITLDGDTSGWPTGASGRNFVATLDRGVAGKMEKVECSDLTAGVLTIATRGFDGTAAIAHDAGCTVEHGLHAGLLDDLSAHVYDTTRDDHDQYILTDGSRPFTNVAGLTDTPVNVGTANAPGTSDLLSRADHVHDIANNAVDTAQIANAAVTAAKIANAQITQALMAAGLQVPIVCTSGTRPGSPTQGMCIYETDTGYVLYYQGATDTWTPDWRLPWGPVAAPKNVTSDQGSISSEVNVTGCSFTWTTLANRLYRHTVRVIVSNNTANSAMVVKICDGANAELDRGSIHLANAGVDDTLAWSWYETGIAAGSVTRKLRAVAGGVSTGALHGTIAPTGYSIDDVGPTGAPS